MAYGGGEHEQAGHSNSNSALHHHQNEQNGPHQMNREHHAQQNGGGGGGHSSASSHSQQHLLLNVGILGANQQVIRVNWRKFHFHSHSSSATANAFAASKYFARRWAAKSEQQFLSGTWHLINNVKDMVDGWIWEMHIFFLFNTYSASDLKNEIYIAINWWILIRCLDIVSDLSEMAEKFVIFGWNGITVNGWNVLRKE